MADKAVNSAPVHSCQWTDSSGLTWPGAHPKPPPPPLATPTDQPPTLETPPNPPCNGESLEILGKHSNFVQQGRSEVSGYRFGDENTTSVSPGSKLSRPSVFRTNCN